MVKYKRRHPLAASAARAARKKVQRDAPRFERACTRVRDGEVQRRVKTRDPGAPARHEAYGRQPRDGRKRGGPRAVEAMREVRERTLECPRCGLFVDYRGCKRAAYRREPAELRVGDGCLGVRCGARSATRSECAQRQRQYRRELVCGKRRLVAWPESAIDTEEWERPWDVCMALVEESRARYPSDDDE